MLALAVEGALTQAYDPGYDGPVVAALSKFEADGMVDDTEFLNKLSATSFNK